MRAQWNNSWNCTNKQAHNNWIAFALKIDFLMVFLQSKFNAYRDENGQGQMMLWSLLNLNWTHDASHIAYIAGQGCQRAL